MENPAYLNEKTDQFGNKISRKVILDLITKLVQRLTGNEVHENNSAEVEIEVSENVEEPESDKNESLNDEFAKFLKDQTAKKGSEVKIQKVTNQRIDKEMKCYEANGTKTENLENLYKSLLTIKPTSVESERAFSAMGLFCTKLRNRLNDDTLNSLVMMRQYYLAQKKA